MRDLRIYNYNIDKLLRDELFSIKDSSEFMRIKNNVPDIEILKDIVKSNEIDGNYLYYLFQKTKRSFQQKNMHI